MKHEWPTLPQQLGFNLCLKTERTRTEVLTKNKDRTVDRISK